MSIPFSLFSSLNTFIPDGLVEDMFFLFGKQIDKMEKECFRTQEDIVELPEWQKQVRNSVNNTAVKDRSLSTNAILLGLFLHEYMIPSSIRYSSLFTYQETLE